MNHVSVSYRTRLETGSRILRELIPHDSSVGLHVSVITLLTNSSALGLSWPFVMCMIRECIYLFKLVFSIKSRVKLIFFNKKHNICVVTFNIHKFHIDKRRDPEKLSVVRTKHLTRVGIESMNPQRLSNTSCLFY